MRGDGAPSTPVASDTHSGGGISGSGTGTITLTNAVVTRNFAGSMTSAGMPVAPALIIWRLQAPDGKVVVPEHVAADFRHTIPDDTHFWSYYARGTYQNMAVFKPHYSWAQPGHFLFKLTRTPFDTKTLKDGVYDLVVTAEDIRGNRGSRTQRLTIHNKPGWS